MVFHVLVGSVETHGSPRRSGQNATQEVRLRESSNAPALPCVEVRGKPGMRESSGVEVITPTIGALVERLDKERVSIGRAVGLDVCPILGIADLRRDTRIEFVGGIRGLGELERRVVSGEMAVAFAMHPTQMTELMSVADAGKVMPPKSPWFEPKLADGLVSYMLDN